MKNLQKKEIPSHIRRKRKGELAIQQLHKTKTSYNQSKYTATIQGLGIPNPKHISLEMIEKIQYQKEILLKSIYTTQKLNNKNKLLLNSYLISEET